MKEWKYRFKRGLASFLTVGMIASGVNVAACIPVYAVEGTVATEAIINNLDDLKAAVYAGLKEQILGMFNGSATKEEKSGFTVLVNFKNQGPEKNEEWQKAIQKDVKNTLEKLLEECPSEMFWYDSSLRKEKCTGQRTWDEKTDIIQAKFDFQCGVKETYRPVGAKDLVTMSVQTIKDTKNAMSDGELEKVIEGIYGNLKGQISKMVNGESTQDEATFTVEVPCNNSDVAKALKTRIDNEKSVQKMVSRLSSECASEFFWYKENSEELTAQSGKCSNYCIISPANKDKDLWLTFYFAVKDEYRAKSDKTNAQSLDLKNIQNTKNNINTILNNEAMSDYAILCKYRDELVNNNKYKGDQLPQAFQWLCDQTAAFQSSGTKCFSVKGTVEGKDRTWNIVTIEGKSYLVDLQNSTGLFLAGVETNATGGYTVGNKVYVPDKDQSVKLPTLLEGSRYRQKQNDFVFETEEGLAGVVGSIHELTFKGSVGTLSFKSNAYATIIGSDSNHVRIKAVGVGTAVIEVTAAGNDYFEPKTIYYKLPVNAADGGGANSDNKNPSGGNTGGSGSGGGTTGGGSSTGGSTGGGGSIGSLSVASVTGPELLPQVDFCIESGTDKIIKSVGAPDFTITAWGQVNDSKVTYASSDPAVATVNAETGTVHIVGAGTATISATASATTLHREEKCEYTVEVQ